MEQRFSVHVTNALDYEILQRFDFYLASKVEFNDVLIYALDWSQSLDFFDSNLLQF